MPVLKYPQGFLMQPGGVVWLSNDEGEFSCMLCYMLGVAHCTCLGVLTTLTTFSFNIQLLEGPQAFVCILSLHFAAFALI